MNHIRLHLYLRGVCLEPVWNLLIIEKGVPMWRRLFFSLCVIVFISGCGGGGDSATASPTDSSCILDSSNLDGCTLG